ncbi:MAG: hypothetical protein ACRD2L_08150 [Terriglobia bacterium]
MSNLTTTWTRDDAQDTLQFSGAGSGARIQGQMGISDAFVGIDASFEIPWMVSLVVGGEDDIKRKINEELDRFGF